MLRGDVLRSNNQQLDYDTTKELPATVKDKQWWQSAYNNGIGYPFVEDVIYDDGREIYLLPVALPIRTTTKSSSGLQQGNTIGVLRTILLLPELTSLVGSQHDLAGTYTFLTNRSGKIIAASPHSGYRIGGLHRHE